MGNSKRRGAESQRKEQPALVSSMTFRLLSQYVLLFPALRIVRQTGRRGCCRCFRRTGNTVPAEGSGSPSRFRRHCRWSAADCSSSRSSVHSNHSKRNDHFVTHPERNLPFPVYFLPVYAAWISLVPAGEKHARFGISGQPANKNVPADPSKTPIRGKSHAPRDIRPAREQKRPGRPIKNPDSGKNPCSPGHPGSPRLKTSRQTHQKPRFGENPLLPGTSGQPATNNVPADPSKTPIRGKPCLFWDR